MPFKTTGRQSGDFWFAYFLGYWQCVLSLRFFTPRA